MPSFKFTDKQAEKTLWAEAEEGWKPGKETSWTNNMFLKDTDSDNDIFYTEAAKSLCFVLITEYLYIWFIHNNNNKKKKTNVIDVSETFRPS